MVAEFLQLRLTLLSNTLRRSAAHRVGMLLGVGWALAAAGVLASGLFTLRSSTPDVARVIIVVCGTCVVLGFLVLPLAFGVDDMLNPRRFALFGIPTSSLALNLAVAGCLSVPTLVIAVLALAHIVTWSRGPLPFIVAIVSALLIVSSCVLCARISSAVASTFLSSRRARDASGIIVVFGLAVAAPLVAVLATVDWQSQGLPIMRRIAAVADWTPFGAAWSAPGDVALGFGLQGSLKLAISAGFLVVLWRVWQALVGVILERAESTVSVRPSTSLGWFRWVPANTAGMIAARSLTYWGRDSRYRVSLAVIPIMPMVIIGLLLLGGLPVEAIAWVPVPLMCLFLGWIGHNDLAHDSSAFWMQVSSNADGVHDRLGRVVPALLLGVPLVIIGGLATVLVSGDPATLPGLIGLSGCLLLAGLGISSVTSAAFPYPAVHPGDSPFAQPQMVGVAGSIVQSAVLASTILTAAPVVWLLVRSLLNPGQQWQFAALGAGILIGTLVLAGGITWGGRIVSARGPELLAFALRN